MSHSKNEGISNSAADTAVSIAAVSHSKKEGISNNGPITTFVNDAVSHSKKEGRTENSDGRVIRWQQKINATR